jgi:hypothetical protein
MSYRIKPQDLTATNSSPFMTTHGARVQIPLADALASPDLFMTVRANLRAGDEVTICRYGTGDWTKARVLERVRVIILQSALKGVEFEAVEDIRILGAAKPELEPEKKVDQLTELEVIPDPQGGFLVREVASGYVHKHFKIKAPAVKYINDYGRKAQAEAA